MTVQLIRSKSTDVFTLGGIVLKVICERSPSSNFDEEDKGQRRRGGGRIIMLMEAMKPSENETIDTKENNINKKR